MTITQKSSKRNKRCVQAKHYVNPLLLLGNEIPYWCYHRTVWQGKTYLIALVVLNELASLKQDFADDDNDFELTNCFSYFWKKFNINKLEMQKASYRLHYSRNASLG